MIAKNAIIIFSSPAPAIKYSTPAQPNKTPNKTLSPRNNFFIKILYQKTCAIFRTHVIIEANSTCHHLLREVKTSGRSKTKNNLPSSYVLGILRTRALTILINFFNLYRDKSFHYLLFPLLLIDEGNLFPCHHRVSKLE